ncbi:restriction endonuclease subunit S [uncultured Brachyspira sp.]|uniref:restriction endonuclease subunit S n=1 Tax=uncultured Brachyspira sp. TaxID=221953 RepID=UPI002626644F|nr:restriction endonuclease subunit S [uncultured Brachyspira sp.]
MANKIDIPDGWEVKKLGEVFKKINIKNKDKLITQVLTNSAQYGVIAQEEFFDKSIATKENINNYYILSIDDFIYNPRISKFAPAGPISRNKYSIGCVSPLYTVFKMIVNYNINFYELYFKSNIWNKQAYNIANFGARFDRMNITDNDFFNMPISVPPLAEQEKIAEILSLWDKAIEQTKELIAYKEKQKKGLMQKYIYPTKNKVSYRIGKLFNLSRGRVISKQEIEENQGIYPVYSSQTSNNGILGFINTYDYDDELITWTTDGANAGKVFARKGKFNCTNVCGIAIPKNRDLCNLLYVTSFLNNITKKYVSYVGNPKLMNNVFEEIELLNKQLDLYTEQKKGLMQNLLTGKVRVTV